MSRSDRAPIHTDEVFRYLSAIRDTGAINPLAAGPLLEEEFEVTRQEARKLIRAWIEDLRKQTKLTEILAGEPNEPG